MNNKLNRAGFTSKVIYQRMLWKYNLAVLDIFKLKEISRAFKIMLEENGYDSVTNLEGISKETFKNLENKMKKNELLSSYDDKFIEAITESLVYSAKLFQFCTYYAGDKCIMQIPELRRVRGPFYDSGFTTVLDLAMIYENNPNPKYLEQIGPKKFDQFQRWFALDCKEFETIK